MDKDDRYYWLRRLHSLTGIVPTGLFLLQHIYGNVLSQWGADHFNDHVHFLIYQPFLFVLEALIIVPLAFHALFGLVYTFNARWNPVSYRYLRNWMYTAQRVTGIITGIFIVLHLASTRYAFNDPQKHFMFEAMANEVAANPAMIILYIIGVTAASFHLCNGVWSFSIMWGLTITRKSQRLLFNAMMGLMVLLIVGGVYAIIGFAGVEKSKRIVPSDEVWQALEPELKELTRTPDAQWYVDHNATPDGQKYTGAQQDAPTNAE